MVIRFIVMPAFLVIGISSTTNNNSCTTPYVNIATIRAYVVNTF